MTRRERDALEALDRAARTHMSALLMVAVSGDDASAAEAQRTSIALLHALSDVDAARALAKLEAAAGVS